jgi:putative ABC transport system permease protein
MHRWILERPMWLISVRDLEWRRRRFAIAVLATGLVLALALLLTGVRASFDNEIERTVSSFGADQWLVAEGAVGPFTAPIGFPVSRVAEVRRASGVRNADPVAIVGATALTPDPENVNVIGAVPGGVGPAREAEDQLTRPGAAIVDERLGVDVGDTIALSGMEFEVVAETDGRTYFAGVPTVVVALPDVQRLGFDNQPLATAIVAEGAATAPPHGFSTLTDGDVKEDLNRPVAQAKQTIGLIRWLLWAVAAGIVGAILYLSTLERTADFAVFKAIGVSTASLVRGLIGQAVALTLAAVGVAIVLELALAPLSAMRVEVPTRAYVELLAVALLAGAAASLAALRRALKIDPALAFAG